MANMAAAFFGNAADAARLFSSLEISRCGSFMDHLNNYHVIFLDFSEEPRDCTAYLPYISHFQNEINQDLAEACPAFHIDISNSTWDILTDIFQKTGDKFIFVINE